MTDATEPRPINPPVENDSAKLIQLLARQDVLAWILVERAHGDSKYLLAEDERNSFIARIRHTLEDQFKMPYEPGYGGPDSKVGPDSYWRDFFEQYVHRAHLLGLDTPAGRQAIFKAGVVFLHFLEFVYLTWGMPPEPGLPSGEIKPWRD